MVCFERNNFVAVGLEIFADPVFDFVLHKRELKQQKNSREIACSQRVITESEE